MLNSDDLAMKAKNNTAENFRFSYDRVFIDYVISRMSQNEKFFMKILEDEEFKAYLMEDLFEEVYGA